MPRLHPKTTTSHWLGWEPGSDSFKGLQVFSVCPRAWEPLCYMILSVCCLPLPFPSWLWDTEAKNQVSKMLSRHHLSNLSMQRNNLESFLKHRVLGPTSRESDLVGWDLSFCIFDLPGGADLWSETFIWITKALESCGPLSPHRAKGVLILVSTHWWVWYKPHTGSKLISVWDDEY